MEIHILRKNQNNDCSIPLFPEHLGAEEREEDSKQNGEEQSRRRERKVDGDPGLRRGLQLRTEMGGDILLVPYAPQHAQGTKRLGNRKLMNRKINKISEVQ